MSNLERPQIETNGDDDDRARGPNLTLLYGIIVIALLAAMAIAGMIVLPFYMRR